MPARATSRPGFLATLTSAWREEGVRFHAVDDLLLEQLQVTSMAERSLRFLIHPEDRHALSLARGLGATVAMANSIAFMCAPPKGPDPVVFVFPLAPLHRLFDLPAIDPLEAAIYFALQAGEEAEARLRAVVDKYRMTGEELDVALTRRYGSFPPLPRNQWLLRASFDPEGARARLASVAHVSDSAPRAHGK
jgi:hypothetical protein